MYDTVPNMEYIDQLNFSIYTVPKLNKTDQIVIYLIENNHDFVRSTEFKSVNCQAYPGLLRQ